jgi:hypothetical protein
MHPRVTAWRLEDLAEAPFRGMRHAHSLRADGEHLAIRCTWWIPAAGFVGLALCLFPVAALVLGLLRRLGITTAEAPVLITAAPLGAGLLREFYRRWGHVEVHAAAGWGRLSLGGFPRVRSFAFPTSAVRGVVLLRHVPARWHLARALPRRLPLGGELRCAVRILLEDHRGRRRGLTLCTCNPRRAADWAGRLARWLRVELAEGDFEDLTRRATVPLKPLAERQARRATSKTATLTIPDSRAGKPAFGLARTFKIKRLSGTVLWVGVAGAVLPFALPLLAAGISMVCVAICFLAGAPREWSLSILVFGVGVFPIGLAVVMFLSRPRWRFDLGTGRIRQHNGPIPLRDLPVAAVAAVQSLNYSRELDLDLPRPFELNLVFRSGKRVTVAAGIPLRFAREAGRRIAEFLGVPWIDHTAGADGGAQP